jgi:hypothetical protein
MSHVRDPKTMKFIIMSFLLSLCLIGYTRLGQASSRSPSKWSVDVAPDAHNALHVGVVHLLAIIVIVMADGGGGPLMMPFPPLLAALDILHGATLLLLRNVSLSPRMGWGLTVSLLAACWAVRVSNSLVVYLKKSFGTRKGDGNCTLCTLIPLGSRSCSFWSLCLLWRATR